MSRSMNEVPLSSLSFNEHTVFQVKACVLSVHPLSRAVRLTLRSPFLHPGGAPRQLPAQRLGAVLEEATVKAFYKQFGAVFELDDGTLAFARVSARLAGQVLYIYLILLGKGARRGFIFLPFSSSCDNTIKLRQQARCLSNDTSPCSK